VAAALKVTLVPVALGLAGATDVRLTDATEVGLRVYVVAVKASWAAVAPTFLAHT
jgi:hypothetical protein